METSSLFFTMIMFVVADSKFGWVTNAATPIFGEPRGHQFTALTECSDYKCFAVKVLCVTPQLSAYRP
jgi:hypothetical protein